MIRKKKVFRLKNLTLSRLICKNQDVILQKTMFDIFKLKPLIKVNFTLSNSFTRT